MLRLPDLAWKALDAVSRPNVENPGLPAIVSQKSTIRLHVSKSAPLDPNGLRVALPTLAEWAERAPQIRLKHLSFACGYDGDAVIRGTPIPSLPGSRFFEQNGVAAPLGQAWDPPVPPNVLSQAMNLAPGDLGLLRADGWERIDAANFVPLTRASVRLTADGHRIQAVPGLHAEDWSK